MVWEALPTPGNLQYSDIWTDTFNLSSVFYYWWLSILLVHHLQSKHNTCRECCEKTQGPNGWHRVNNGWGTRTDWGNSNFNAFPPKLFKSCVVYVVLGATAIWYWNIMWLVTSYNFRYFFKGSYFSRWIIELVFKCSSGKTT